MLANNEALNGGAIYANNADINISGGVISGNESTRASGDWDDHSEGAPYRCGGGGIFANGSTALNMSGGYITNNTAADDDYFDGGGGVLISGTTRFAMSGGYITGNEAAGGGGVRSDWNKATTFLMSGGFISGNTACSAEGGGVAITQGGTGTVTGGYITNNTITNTVHWGGGGLFCSDGAYLRVYHVLVTDNHAGGFGGGVAGCSTGRVYICVKDGGAIYDNSASGTKLSDGGSQKNEDHVYAADSPVFMDNGYQDYFCALNSMVEGSMLGGGSANWSGSIDGVAISNVPSDALLEAAYIMGLTAHPSDEAIAAAQGVASVFINGNSSDTHGGGILCNGYLLVGDRNPIAVGSRFTLKGTKKLLEDGKDVSLQGYQFTFSVKDEAGNIVSIGTSDESGNINFDRLLSFNEELCRTKIELSGGTATFVYYLTEDESLNTVVDKTQYKISVTIKRTDQNLPFTDDADKPIVKIYYQITGVTVEKSMDEGETWQAASYTWTAPSSEQHGGELKITNGATFTNQKTKTVSLIVHKQWVGTGNPPESIKVDLLSDGTVIDTVDLNADNHWSYRWDKLAEGSVYTVEEHPVPGYEATYENGSGSETVKGWIPAVTVEAGKRYLIVAADNTALTGSPNTNGAYYFGNGNFKNVIISDKGIISDSGITEEMQWEAVSFSGRAGVYLKNLPSAGKHYLSYQIENGNHNVKATSDTTSYATKVVPDCSNGLKLYRFGSDDTQNIRYVMKSESTLKASESDSNAVRLYVWAGGDDEHVITITNTKVSKLYDVDITKVSAMDPGKTLAGAEFQLLQGEAVLNFSYDAESGVYTYTRETAGDVTDTLITGEGGRLHLTGLPEGTYQLHETKAPSGYELAADTEIQLGETNESVTVEYTIEDQEILYSLPETGGNGTYGYILWGLLLMTTSLGIYGTRIFKNRKERGEYKS